MKSEPDVMDEIGCREMSLRMIAAVVLVCVAVTLTGCTYTRNAPLIEHNAPFIDFNIKDSANGNTVPVSAVP